MSKNYSTDDIGDSMVLGWKLVREIIEFFLFKCNGIIFRSRIGVGTDLSQWLCCI